ncbi:MAG: hypothetical protein V4542_00180 [Pseudomonadota bacterium]
MRVLTLEEMELVAGGCGKPKAKSCKPAPKKNCGPKKPSRGGCGGRSNSSSEDGGTVTPPPPPPVDTGTL